MTHGGKSQVENQSTGNGSYSQAEIKAPIDSMSGELTTNQKAVLRQLATGARSAKNNPYSQKVEQKVLVLLVKMQEPEQELEYTFCR